MVNPNLGPQRVAHGGMAEQTSGAGGKSPRLRLEVVHTLPNPVIGRETPGAGQLLGGFEGGNSLKIVVGGRSHYHLFAQSYPLLDWSRCGLDHWVSDDGRAFRHAGMLLEDFLDEATGERHIFTMPMPFFYEPEQRWYLSYGEFVSKDSWVATSGNMWCAPARIPGLEGINGSYDFAKRQIFVPRQTTPVNLIPISNSAPFQVQDERWAVLVCPDGEAGAGAASWPASPRWPVTLHFAADPRGPFLAPDPLEVPPMIEPTGYTENPMVIKVKGPKSGRDYWVGVFDFLAPEVTEYQPKNVFGFSWSADGIHWPAEHGQVVNVDDGLAQGQRGWWRGSWAIRTPHQLLEEGDGLYTIFFTGATTENYFEGFRAVGKLTVRLVEE